MIAATKQARDRRFTHRFVFNTNDVVKTVDGEVTPCDYLVLYLDGDPTPTIENWYCTYE